MGEITTVGLDLAKNVFQVHAIDGTGKVLARRRLGRSEVLDWFCGLPPCLVARIRASAFWILAATSKPTLSAARPMLSSTGPMPEPETSLSCRPPA